MTRRGRLLRLALVLVLVAGGAVVWILGHGAPAPDCTLRTTSGTRDLPRAEAVRLTGIAARDEVRSSSIDATARELGGDRPWAAALRGGDGPALSCHGAVAHDLPRQGQGRSGLTPRAVAVRMAMAAVYGRQSLGGFAPGGVSAGHIEGSAHYEGRAIDVFYRPVSRENRRQGWVLAQWLVARADRLDVATVIFDDHLWSAQRADEGWRRYVPPEGDPRNPILRHLDHVHVDVVRGR